MSLASIAFADGAVLTALRDFSIYSESGNVASGEGVSLFVGRTTSRNTRCALLFFDVAAALPANAQIQSVELKLHLNRTNAGFEDVSVHRALASWGEGASNGGVPS